MGRLAGFYAVTWWPDSVSVRRFLGYGLTEALDR